jgi:hypothetical protein
MGSAAALTLGSHTVPVYEIYKVGAEPEWVAGLDLMSELAGLSAVVVPHYDNAEGGTHDTRFCYLGEQRLVYLESLLPPGTGVLGVDEHTAVVFDLAAGVASVTGRGVLSVRRGGETTTFGSGTVLPLADLDASLRGAGTVPGPAVGALRSPGEPTTAPADDVVTSVREEADRARKEFDAALARRDVAGCVAVVLGLETAITAWRADTLQSDDVDEARRVLRAMVVRLGELATDGIRDPSERIGPYVDLLLDLRTSARAAQDFATSDLVRDRLGDLGVEVRDTPDGPTWGLADV